LAALLLFTASLSAPWHDALASGTSTADLLVLAERGSAVAQRTLGERFATGTKGASKDMERAVYWWQRAADKGDAMAQYNLGMAHLLGAGVPQDSVKAHMWLSLSEASARETVSARQGRMLAGSERKAMEAAMQPKQIEESVALAQLWLAQHR
jgi:TPR repeat protein